MGPFVKAHRAAWDAVTTYNDGSPAVGIGYKVYWRDDKIGFNDQDVHDVGAPTEFDLLALNLNPGKYVIAVTAYDQKGNESALSESVPFDFIVPSSPTGLLIS